MYIGSHFCHKCYLCLFCHIYSFPNSYSANVAQEHELQVFMVLISATWYLIFQSVFALETFEDFGPCWDDCFSPLSVLPG